MADVITTLLRQPFVGYPLAGVLLAIRGTQKVTGALRKGIRLFLNGGMPIPRLAVTPPAPYVFQLIMQHEGGLGTE